MITIISITSLIISALIGTTYIIQTLYDLFRQVDYRLYESRLYQLETLYKVFKASVLLSIIISIIQFLI